VGRGKKKALLAHIINLHNWSQVLVFTRTKYGANNVADFLTKNGIKAMALHGNKSQGARTQALAGFKSGEIRALVATDIAARGIDIDELPHVVNYEIPNVCEDYVHRIGRTGRAGKSGEAVNLVSLDEEGFMMDIERFTRQQIPVEMFQEFMPEPGEKAEPIAMGRQTIWGGAGKPPSRDVMAAAAKAARQEMMTRIREKKTDGEGGRGGNRGNNPPRQRSAQAGEGQTAVDGQGQGEGRRRNRNRRGGGDGNGQPRQGNANSNAQPRQNQERQPRAPREDRYDGEDRPERQPGPNAHLGSLRIREPRARAAAPGGQPDPLRTSIDSMRTGNRGKNRGGNGGGSGQRGGGGGGGNGAGGADPLRTSFGRIR
jgi:ATP-dependent RNA helicase RhlE